MGTKWRTTRKITTTITTITITIMIIRIPTRTTSRP